jgi:hypothetical protein
MSIALLVTLSQAQASSADDGASESRYGGRATGHASLVTLPDDAAYPVPAPLTTALPPATVDAPSPWQQNMVCDPVDRPGVEAFGNLIGKHYNRPGYTTSRACRDQKSEHYDGRAIAGSLTRSTRRTAGSAMPR